MNINLFSLWTAASPVSNADFKLSLFHAALLLLLLLIYITSQLRHIKVSNSLRYTDTVTKQSNFLKFEKDAEKLLERRRVNYAILYINLKNFKVINETLGFSAGDKLLRQLSDSMSACLHRDELLARKDSVHFAALLEYHGKEQFAERLNNLIFRVSKLPNEVSSMFVLNIEIGVYILTKSDENIVSALDKANFARIRAPGSGASYFAIYNDHVQDILNTEIELLSDMNDAFENGEFEVYYQPKVRIDTREISGAEALVRWQHRKKGLMSPAEFIGCFEETGYITRLDLFVFEEVCKQLAEWKRDKVETVPISCNFSSRHFSNHSFADNLVDIAKKYDVDLSLLEIEISETAVIKDLDEARSQFFSLKSKGFKLVIDDFGAGEASLGLIKDFPVDTIKLDKSFVTRSSYNKSDRAMIESIVTLINALNKTPVCEGVETLEQINLLKEVGCITAQGFYYSKPLKSEDFILFGENLKSIREGV